MISNATFITSIIAVAAMAVAMMTLVTKLLGDRVTDLGTRMTGLDTRMNATEGAIRDVAQRLTALETDLGKH